MKYNLASVRNEVSCINTTLDDGGKVWLTVNGERSLVSSAEEIDGCVNIRLEEAIHENLKIYPTNVLPGGRGVWEQIELEFPRNGD
jgi:hypothetical protein